jgi:hypothetical protein
MNEWWRLAPDEHRFAGELRHAAVGEKISQDAIHAWLWKGDRILKNAVDDQRRVAVFEELQVLAHDECVKELLVHEIEATDRAILPRVVDRELQDRRPPRLWCLRNSDNIGMELDRLRNTGDQGHSTSTTLPGTVRANVGIHRTAEDDRLRRVGNRRTARDVLRNKRRAAYSSIRGCRQTVGNDSGQAQRYSHTFFVGPFHARVKEPIC